MLYDDEISEAIDLIASDCQDEANQKLEAIIDLIKKNLTHSNDDIPALLSWALCLELLEEFEQALLKYEDIIRLDPEQPDALWNITQLFLDYLSKPREAENILREKLLKSDPENPEYLNALKNAEYGVAAEDREEIMVDTPDLESDLDESHQLNP
jgi:tetratricopeptide (TPR) repeat protein